MAAKNTGHSDQARSTAGGDVGQPVRAHAGELAQDEGVDAVGDAARPRRRVARRSSRRSRSPRARSHPRPLRPRCRGSGGGAPDGRRRRRVCLTVGGTATGAPAASPAGADRPAVPAGCISVVIAAARPPARRPPPPPAPSHRRRRRSARRRVSVVKRRDTSSSTAVTPVPHRSTTSVRTSGRDVLRRLQVSVVDQLDQVASG